MIQQATAMTVRQNLGKLLNEVEYRHDTILITKAGKPVAALIDIDLFEKIRRMKTEFEHMCAHLAGSYQGVDPTVIEQEITEAIKEVRGK